MNEKKIYCGKGKVFGEYGQISIGLEVGKILCNNNNGYCRINIAKMKEPDEKGNTHYAYLDTWRPTQRAEGTGTPPQDDMPF